MFGVDLDAARANGYRRYQPADIERVAHELADGIRRQVGPGTVDIAQWEPLLGSVLSAAQRDCLHRTYQLIAEAPSAAD